MSTTKTAKPSVAEQTRTAREAYDAACGHLAELRSTCIITADRIKQTWRSGQSTYSAMDYVTADAQGERLKLLISAAEQEVRAAKRKLIPEDIGLAEQAAVLLGAEFDVPAEAHALPPAMAYESGARPTLYVVQNGEAEAVATASNGALTGRLTVYLVRSDVHRELDPHRVLKALDAAGWRFKETHNESLSASSPLDGIGYVDKFIVETRYGYGGLPALPAMLDLRDAGVTVAGGVRNRMADMDQRVGTSQRILRDTPVSTTVLSDRTDDGLRTVTAEVVFTVASKNIDPSNVIDLAGNAAPSLVGTYTSLGKVTEASLASPTPDGLCVRLTAVSKAQ